MAGLGAKTETLTAPQARFLAELVKARTILDAAKATGTSETTARRWLALPHVQAAYRAMRHELVDSAVTGMQNASRAAVATLVKNLTAESPAAQIRAAQVLIENVIQATQMDLVLERLGRLEERVAEQQKGPMFHRNGVPIDPARPMGGPRGS
jgi:hypothetical protein